MRFEFEFTEFDFVADLFKCFVPWSGHMVYVYM